MTEILVDAYVREDGSCPYVTWRLRLDRHAEVKIAVAESRLRAGLTASIKWFRGIGEVVIDWGPGYRIYLARDGDHLIILLGGSSKQGQQKAIDAAVALHAEYKARKKAVEPTQKGRTA